MMKKIKKLAHCTNWNASNCSIVWEYTGKRGFYNGLSYVVCSKNSEEYITIIGYDQSNIEVEIPESIDEIPVTSIGANAFRGCNSLTNVVIPSSATIIGKYAFMNCTLLTIYCET